MEQKITKHIFRFWITFLFITTFFVWYGNTTMAYSVNNMKCYTITSGNTKVVNSSGTKIGTIYGSDELIILSGSGNQYYVQYPTSKGSKKGYIPKTAVVVQTSGNNRYASAKITTYKRPGGQSYGYIDLNDPVLKMGTSGNYTQVRYPAGSIYKFAWIKNADTKYLSTSKVDTQSASGSFQWPLTKYYVCGNKWSEYYSAKGKDHLGMDIKSNTGDTNVYATGNGTVVQRGWNSANGNTITIKHTISGKTVYSFYAHLKSISVSNGQSIKKGQKIGVIGNTGASSTGTHLHFSFTTQCSAGTYGYGTKFQDNANVATYNNYTYYNPAYIINNGKLP